ncbi:MAG: hypothetical protein ACTSYM_04175 [Candidatus Baldrarchaeia archaeon]
MVSEEETVLLVEEIAKNLGEIVSSLIRYSEKLNCDRIKQKYLEVVAKIVEETFPNLLLEKVEKNKSN